MPIINPAGHALGHVGQAAAAQLQSQAFQQRTIVSTLGVLDSIKRREFAEQRYAAGQAQELAEQGQKRLKQLRDASAEAMAKAGELGFQYSPQDFHRMRSGVEQLMPQAAMRIEALYPPTGENEAVRFTAYADAYDTAMRARDMGSKQAQFAGLVERQEVSGGAIGEEGMARLEALAADPNISAAAFRESTEKTIREATERTNKRARQEMYASRANAIRRDEGYQSMIDDLAKVDVEQANALSRDLAKVEMGEHSDPQRVFDDIRIRTEGLERRVGQMKQEAYMAGMATGRRQAAQQIEFSFLPDTMNPSSAGEVAPPAESPEQPVVESAAAPALSEYPGLQSKFGRVLGQKEDPIAYGVLESMGLSTKPQPGDPRYQEAVQKIAEALEAHRANERSELERVAEEMARASGNEY